MPDNTEKLKAAVEAVLLELRDYKLLAIQETNFDPALVKVSKIGRGYHYLDGACFMHYDGQLIACGHHHGSAEVEWTAGGKGYPASVTVRVNHYKKDAVLAARMMIAALRQAAAVDHAL